MPKQIDLIGKKFHLLTVIKADGKSKDGHLTYLCKCDCGNEASVQGRLLRNGNTKSCGCLRATSPFKHGSSYSRLYYIYNSMKDRCSRATRKDYKYYGGKGITVCEEWLNSFETFKEWAINNGYTEELTIDRIDNAKGYCPTNCKWSTRKEQSQNRTNVKRREHESKRGNS